MFKNSKGNKILISAGLFLIAMNFFAFYIIKKTIGIAEAIKNTENKDAINSLEQKKIFGDVFPSLIFTVDIAVILFLV